MIGRYKLSELSAQRLLSSLKIRIGELPHWMAWYFHPLAIQNKERIRRFAGIHKGERCFIVANGPSLRNTNLDFLINETTFGLNRIYLYFSETAFRPTYYVTMNELILEQFSTDINKLAVPMFLNWNRRRYFEENSPNKVYLKSRMVIKDYFEPDLTKPLVVGATVTFVALQIAYYMGFQEVVLVGLDHDYAEKGVPSGLETRTSEKDLSHFHPQYFPKGVRWQLPDLLRSEIDFALARRAYEADGRKIYDATINGKCAVFEKKEYSTFFG